MSTIYYIGDSTVQTNMHFTFPQTGIGQVFQLFLNPGYKVVNLAKNGRSTKSFIEEGRFKAVEERIESGDFLFIQFGHNDEKKEDPARYTDPKTTYRENLEFFTETAKKAGAYPVIITPIERRKFDENGKLRESAHTQYVEADLEFGQEKGIPVIDLCKESRELLKRLGDEGSKPLYMNFPENVYLSHPEGKNDDTHLRYYGAFTYASMIAEALKSMGDVYEEVILAKMPEEDIFEKNGNP